MNIKKSYIIICILLIVVFGGCGTIRVGKGSFGYNMQGVTIPSGCKTANVRYFENRASLVQPSLSQDITERLKDKILSDTPLKLTNGTGDVNFSGEIVRYSTEPVAPQAGAIITSAYNRLTIAISVSYNNSKDAQFDYSNSTFQRYIDYPSTMSLEQAERSDDYKNMIDLLVQDVFTKAFVNW